MRKSCSELTERRERANHPGPLRFAHSVVIQAPLDAVWEYVSDSTSATDWSVYFHHIAPLPESPEPDGRVGSLRRCFRRADGTGVRWDEEVTIVETPDADGAARREIRTYALRGFRRHLAPLAARTEYRVEQRFTALSESTTRLTFSTDLHRPNLRLARALFGPFGRETVRVFRLNLQNIAAAVEAKLSDRAPNRPHPYEAIHPWD